MVLVVEGEDGLVTDHAAFTQWGQPYLIDGGGEDLVADIEVFGVGSLAQVVGYLSGQLPLEPTTVDVDDLFNVEANYDVDFADVKGQESVKRALTVAAAGGHNII